MFRRIFAFIFCFSLICGTVFAETFRHSEYVQLSNGISVIFLDTHSSDNCFVTLCLSVGKSDDLNKSGKAELLGRILVKKLKQELNNGTNLHNVEMAHFIGQDQSLFSFIGKLADLSSQIKSISKYFYNLDFTPEELEQEKRQMINIHNQNMMLSKSKLRQEALKLLYWHNNMGKPFSVDEFQSISMEDLQEFQKSNYTNDRIIIIISGHLKNKDEIKKWLEENFSNKRQSNMQRLREPNHHNSTVSFEMKSSQIKFPFVEIYWRLPNYKPEFSVYDKDESFRTVSPLALDIFLRYLDKELKKSLVDELKIASDVTLNYSLWNYRDGDVRISIILNNQTYSKETEFEILYEIKRIAFELSTKELKSIQNELAKSADVFTFLTDVIDTMNWLSEKVAVGYDYEFLKNYKKSVKDFELATVKEEVVKFFKKEPSVISVLNPEERK